MTLSYMKNQDIMIFLELHKIFPQLISKNNDFIIDEDKKLLGVFSYSYNNKTMRLMIIIQEANKNINFRCKMKKKTQNDFYEHINDKKDIINDLKSNIIEEIFSSFIII